MLKTKFHQLVFILFSLVLGIFLITSVGQANLISNGSFEDGDDPGFYTTLVPGDTDIEHWTITAGSIDYIGTYWTASDGDFSIDMSGDVMGTIEIATAFATDIGTQYVVQFDMAGNPEDQGPPVKQLQIDAGSDTGSFTFNTTGHSLAAMGWEEQVFIFTAINTATVISFQSLTAGAWGPALDNVRVNAVPEPTTMLLLGAGLVGLFGLGRKKFFKKS